MATGDVFGAIEWYRKALRVDRNVRALLACSQLVASRYAWPTQHKEAQTNIAQALKEWGRGGEALQEFEKALKMDSK